MKQLSNSLRLLILATTVLGLVAIVAAVLRAPEPLIEPGAWPLLAVVIAADMVSTRISFFMWRQVGGSPTLAAETASLVLLGPWWTLWVVLLGMTFTVLMNRSRFPWYKGIYNLAQSVVGFAIAGWIYTMMMGSAPFDFRNVFHLLAAAVAMTIDFAVNYGLVMAAVAIEKRKSYRQALELLLSGPIYELAMIPLGLTLAGILRLNLWLGAGLVLPLMSAHRAGQLENRLTEETHASMEAMARLVDQRDRYTSEHSQRVAEYAVQLGRQVGLAAKQLESLRRGCLVHDVGKVVLADEILKGNARLSVEQWQAVNRHPTVGYELVKNLTAYKACTDIVRYHHERYDGTGYPSGLKGTEIPLLARIAVIADAYDAMTSDRSYRPAMTREEALGELLRHAGTQFDPDLAALAAKVFAA